jgi:DNA-binding protein HU-beta
MTKEEFVTKLAGTAKVTKKQAEEMLSAFIGMIGPSLTKGEWIALPGLGVFSVVRKMVRTGRNPATGAAIQIVARKAVKLSASSTLKQSLNKTKT